MSIQTLEFQSPAVPVVLLAPTLLARNPVKLHPANPHYFSYHGKAIVLITSREHHAYQVNDPAGKRAESTGFKGYLRSLAKFLAGFDLARMRRDAALVLSGLNRVASHVSAIAEPGRQYAIYIHHSSSDPQVRSYKASETARRTTLSLSLPAGRYKSEWLRPGDPQNLGMETIGHKGGTMRLRESPEYTADIALRIMRTGS